MSGLEGKQTTYEAFLPMLPALHACGLSYVVSNKDCQYFRESL